ncbi:hypothetical protein C2869_18345 [Saccharobesus litoralis]|uniref:Solute-binding protein family 3/N-terminal domain-containing protein n=1 Tax=Saccharobesus litoralis TaxID=2172099 RepID=A0A2S0VVK8_9ALTE|nr:hypothetical protein [Saccharobesus litoralis]AWB68251.1 hypothetical protein C2869_18345 [Saccharobesus litoralis]
MQKTLSSIALLISILLLSTNANAETRLTLQASYDIETTETYEYQVLQLALNKTQSSYGKYQLSVTPKAVPPSRLIVEANSSRYENFIFLNSASQEAADALAYARFPALLGIIGYRVAFVSNGLKQQGYSIDSREELMRFTMLQGRGWLDGDILKDNGFTLKTGRNILGLYHMVANDRANFFPIGANQIQGAWQHFNHVEGLAIDDKVVMYYPLPRFFFMSKQNQAIINRIERGLIAAYDDGSLQTLWQKHFKPALDFVNLKERKLFKFKNNYISGIDSSYEKYIFDPFAN